MLDTIAEVLKGEHLLLSVAFSWSAAVQKKKNTQTLHISVLQCLKTQCTFSKNSQFALMQLFVRASNGNLIPYSPRETVDTTKTQKTRHCMMIHILRNISLLLHVNLFLLKMLVSAVTNDGVCAKFHQL